MVYQAWVFRLESSGSGYRTKYLPYAKFGWDSYAFKFTHPVTDTDMGRNFKAALDDSNLFTRNLTQFVRADSLAVIVEQLLRGQTVNLSGAGLNLTQMTGFLLSIEPENETGPAIDSPASPFLAGYANDSGKFEMVYPYNYRHPDFNPTYFLATPTDSLNNMKKATDTNHIQNEHRGIWFGFIDTSHYDMGVSMARPDTVLRKLARDLLPGWQFEGWVERNGVRASTGHFIRGDSADLENPYAVNPDSVFTLPGEDFLVNPPAEFANPVVGLLNSTVLITLEPRPDNDPEMFPVILFKDIVPSDDSLVYDLERGFEANIHQNIKFENRARFFPKIRVRIIPEPR
jgi:hypothetical protein